MFGRIVDPSSMLVSATVNQADVESIRIGAKAMLHFDAFPGLELPGHIVGIGAMTQPGRARAEYVREVPVMVKIDRMDPRVIPDLSVSVDVLIDKGRGRAGGAARGALPRTGRRKPLRLCQERRPV
jgi:HlyD family secretion protein